MLKGFTLSPFLLLISPSKADRTDDENIGKRPIINAARYYFEQTGRRVIFEYTLIEGQNDTEKDARNLAGVLKGFPAHVNLIRLNPVRERNLSATKNNQAQKFLGMLESLGVSATIRRQMGVDINGACGQLRNDYLKNES